MTLLVTAFYRFFDLEDPKVFRDWAKAEGERLGLLGTVLVAAEGVNGTVAGEATSVRSFLEQASKRLGNVEFNLKESWSEVPPFRRLRVRVKKEIVTFGQQDAVPMERTGTYLDPAAWNEMLEEEGVVVVDTRNDYEVKAGRFPGAINPGTENFQEFPEFIERELGGLEDKKILMYCTGGIRCEKATSLLLAKDFQNVYHLEGGILRYLEETPAVSSKWDGECFVFDRRVALDHDLKPGQHEMCWMCGWPLDNQDREHDLYEAGISCERCFGKPTESELSRARERQKQAVLKEQREKKDLLSSRDAESLESESDCA